ncbi:MAG TPA: carbamoyltransferase C-terminal domain-containing protein [Pyrinomonadaceae bacterium]
MLVLGISGGLDQVYAERDFLFPYGTFHDSAAVLVEDGKVVAGIEEERLNRIKHTSKGAVSAIRFCLESHGLRLNELDQLAVYADEKGLGPGVRRAYYRRLEEKSVLGLRDIVHEMLVAGLNDDIDDRKLLFVPHHMAHAASAYSQSGYDQSLVLTIDGVGDAASGMILNGKGAALELLHVISVQKSLGLFYLDVIRFLGYDQFEEYKVMGLAPYGDPRRYRSVFRSFYRLLPDGDYILNPDFPDILCKITQRRGKHEPFTQLHKDIAAALQETLEAIVFHVIAHYQKKTGQRSLCLAGGVAHNCSLNGKLLYSGMFDNIFVQPASHDAGCAIGAALFPFFKQQSANGGNGKVAQLDHVYWGTEIGNDQTVRNDLEPWRDFLEFEFRDDIAADSAELLAQGFVVGWVQGRSEFGPRALGNRSIVADPRPAENKDIINSMVKKREAYRPFAPAVLEEYIDEFFELPRPGMDSPFMTFVVRVREDKRELLKATTHVDGTARIQTVSRSTNSSFWQLIDEFRKRTDVPVLLNTSFNNNAEPIVDSVQDAIVCFLTTKLHYLSVGNYLVSKKNIDHEKYLTLVPQLPPYARLTQTKRFVSPDHTATFFEIGNTYAKQFAIEVSRDVFHLLDMADGVTSLGDLLSVPGRFQADTNTIVDELVELWSKRVVKLRPSISTDYTD